MPPYVDVHADAGRRTTVAPESARASGTAAPAAVPAPAGAGRRGLGDAALGIVALLVFASVMTVVSGRGAGESAHAGHAAHQGPVAADYLPIGAAEAVRPAPRPGPAASTGSFTALCGRNAGGHRNSGNFITAPGHSNGAHHVHDYVGNVSTDGGSTDRSLAAAATTCAQDDRSVYFWPVLRDIRHAGADAEQPGGGQDGNLGHILTPDEVAIDFLGNPIAPVRPMPRFLRIVTGDAKALTRGTAAARARWTCSGTPGRASATHYPLCPAGQSVQRIGEFPSCWNGVDLDSDTHRTHVTFPDPVTGACATGTVPIPRLRITVSYRVPAGRSYAVDTFPDQKRKPVTDHFDFENLMPDTLMARVTACIDAGRTC
jgi:Domain of unknown function (DUF1996)